MSAVPVVVELVFCQVGAGVEDGGYAVEGYI